MFCRILLLAWFSLLFSPLSLAATDEQQQFIDMMVSKHQFDADKLHTLFEQSTVNQNILQAIAKPWEAKPWFQYYPIFLTQKRLDKGLAFWQQYGEALTRAEQQSGVPAEIIVAIIGVETFYGSYTGKYPVFEALNTLGFYYPPRAKFFRSELAQLLLLAREENFDVSTLQGSYAGAMGWGQFIPSSYREYAVDFDGDGIRDLLNNPVDAIGSVANYFKRHGWQQGQDIAYPVKVSGEAYRQFLSADLKLNNQWQTLSQYGISLSEPAQSQPEVLAKVKVKLLELALADQQDYWLVLPNFYAITRYNHSPLYAMVIYQFSQQLKQAFNTHVDTSSRAE